MKTDLTNKVSGFVNKIDEKNRIYIFWGILIFVFIIDYLLIMRPQLSTLMNLNPKINILKQDIKKAKEDIARLTQYQKQVKDLNQDVKIHNSRIKSKEDLSLVLERISLIAEQNDIRIDQIRPDPLDQELLLENEDRKYYALPILIDAKCGYHQFGQFLSEIEQDDVAFNIESFAITASSNTKSHNIKLTLKAIIYEGQ